MIELNSEKVFYAFDKTLEPAMTVESGATVRIKTIDCFGNQIQTPEDTIDALDWDRVNPATGPIYVEGAVAGGALKVSIDKIEFDAQAVCATGKDEGVCGDLFEEWSVKLLPIEGEEVVWNDKLRLPLRAMIGVIGVAPAGEPVGCGTPGSHGGNMDNTAITAGATLYFPVAVDGALFGCGDMHAVMGDGEVCVCGAEAPGHATVTLTALPELALANPVIENATHFGTIASADTLDQAAEVAVHDMVRIVSAATGADEAELTMLFSLVGDVEVCQMVDPQKTIRFMVPKYALDAYGFQF